jgi:hypothetical protein
LPFSEEKLNGKNQQKKSTMSQGPADAVKTINDFLSAIPLLKFNRKVSLPALCLNVVVHPLSQAFKMPRATQPSKTKATARATSQKENRLQPTGNVPDSGPDKASAMEIDQVDNPARKGKQVGLETSELFLALLMLPILSLIPILSLVPSLSRLYRSLNQTIVIRSPLIVE